MAFNAVGSSVLGEYVVRIYDQARGRPQYVVGRTVNLCRMASPGPASTAFHEFDDVACLAVLAQAERLPAQSMLQSADVAAIGPTARTSAGS